MATSWCVDGYAKESTPLDSERSSFSTSVPTVPDEAVWELKTVSLGGRSVTDVV